MPHLDIAIVGAGPAGCVAAWALARAGARVRIFDASHPREKPCGGGLTGRAVSIVRPILGPAMVPGVAVSRLRFQTGALDAPRTVRLSIEADTPPLLVVSRKILDAALLDAAVAAGAELTAERVLDVEVGPDRAAVVTRTGRHQCGSVIGADGVTSLVRRKTLAPFTRTQLTMTSGYFVAGCPSPEAVVHTIARPSGYLWSFPRPDHLAVGVGAPAAQIDGTASLRSFVAAWLRREGVPEGTWRAYNWPIPSLGGSDLDRLPVAGPRWMLIGDAAGLVDPLTREGLFYALESGRLAAEALVGAGDPAEAYGARIADDVRPELARAAALQSMFFSSGFSDMLVDALERSVPIRAVMVDLVAGRQPYKSLRRRLVGTFEVGLAWRLLRMQVRGMAFAGDRRGAM